MGNTLRKIKQIVFKKTNVAILAIGVSIYYLSRPFKNQISEVKLSYFLVGLAKGVISEVVVIGPKLLFRGVDSDVWYQTNAAMLSKDRIYKVLKKNPDLVFSSVGNEGDSKNTNPILNLTILAASYLLGFYIYQNYFSSENLSSGGHLRENMKSDTTFNDVHGLEYAKSELGEIISYLRDPQAYQNIGARLRRGVLLHGPPGPGKTLLAKATAGESNASFLFCTASEFVEIYVGMGAKRIRQLFEKARRLSPCIIFIDEIDGIGSRRSNQFSDQVGSDIERITTLNQLLTEMDGFRENENIVVIAATNRILLLDDALIRSGRFDTKIKLDLPTEEERVGIMNVHLKKKKQSVTEKALNDVAAITKGFSGADLENLVNEAAYLAIKEKRELIGDQDILNSAQKIISQKELRH